MSYNEKLPMDDEYIASGPADIRENFRALKEDRIVDAGTLAGLTPGNAGGNIPISNGNLNANLNAERVGGKLAADFANVSHTHTVATGSSNGFLANTDKTKLDTIATGAEVNQNAFSNILVGSTTIQADSKTDTLEIVAGANITLAPDATNDRVTIAVGGTLPVANGGTGAATPAEALDNLGIAATVTELNYLDGVTDNVQTQLNSKSPISHASTDATYGVANAINYGHVMASSVTPLANGIATVGTDNGKFAREGHVHPMQTTITGNAATATKLATARTITVSGDVYGSTTFDGSADVTLTLKSNQGVAPHGKQMFTSSGTFTVPDGVTTVYISGTGGGGGGQGAVKWGSSSPSYYTGGGGGGGAVCLNTAVTVTPGADIAVTVGVGGVGGPGGTASAGSAGGASSFGPYVTLPGGAGGGTTAGSTQGNFLGGVAGGPGGSPGQYGGAISSNQCVLGGSGGGTVFAPPSYTNGVTVAANGNLFGGGGPGGTPAGGGMNFTLYAGGKGANGFILVEW